MSQSALAFEREFLSAFRGELRKVNELLPKEEQSSGTACRVAAFVVGTKFSPQSEQGKLLLMQHRQRTQADSLYSMAGLGTSMKAKTIPRISVHRVGEGGDDGREG